MVSIILPIVLIYYFRYVAVKKAGKSLKQWRSKILIRYLWVVAFILFLSSAVIAYKCEPFLKPEAVIICALGIFLLPVLSNRIWCYKKTLAIIPPVVLGIAAIVYVPLIQGLSFDQVLSITQKALTLIIILGAAIDFGMVLLILVVLFIIGIFTIPAVYII